MDKIKEHYIKEANKMGTSNQSTMKDINIRNKEVEMILNKLSLLSNENTKVLELGCGNGATAEIISQKLTLELTAVDFCEEFIDLAKQRNLKQVNFIVGNVSDLCLENESFDMIFTERCLINLNSWEDQKKSLCEIRRVLKKGGYVLLLEGFSDGMRNLNDARESVGLDIIPEPFHNRFFEREHFVKFIEKDYKILSSLREECFLSSYYFGSKVLYPAILLSSKKKLEYNNKFIEFFSHLPSYGNYSYVKMFLLKKK